uniref:Uncharacterized protein n=1 Tax=Eutreptiella gymnastica TaxID=73025 RepID=A0A7S4LHA1_9EUGL
MRQHCLQLVAYLRMTAEVVEAALPAVGGSAAFKCQRQCLHSMRQHCLQLVAATPAHGSGSAFTMWQHCLQTVVPPHCLQSVVPLPLQCCMPLECCSTASQHCSTASGLQQHCLWTAAALLLDSDTAFPMRQHCLQLVAALPSHGSGRAFTMRQQHCC